MSDNTLTRDELYGTFTSPVPPISERIRCKGCKKVRAIEIIRDLSNWSPVNRKKRNEYRIIGWRYLGYGHFCTQTCATFWANRVIDSGRIL